MKNTTEKPLFKFSPLTKGLGLKPRPLETLYRYTGKKKPLLLKHQKLLPQKTLVSWVPDYKTNELSGVSVKNNTPEGMIIQLGFYYTIRRMSAWLFDQILALTLLALAISGFLFGFAREAELLGVASFFEDFFSLQEKSFLLIFILMLVQFYQIFFETLFASSPGKWLFGLKLGGSPLKRFVRALVFIPSFFGLSLGLFHRRRTCLHDWLTGLQPLPSEEGLPK